MKKVSNLSQVLGVKIIIEVMHMIALYVFQLYFISLYCWLQIMLTMVLRGAQELKTGPYKLILDYVFSFRSALLLSENQVAHYAKPLGKNGTG